MNNGDNMNGILPVYKEAGMTSHDVVAKLRGILHTRKIGHSGTLDPDATGVLLVLIGPACKCLPFLEDSDKEYVATLKLGVRTFSDDSTGDVLEEKEITPIQDFDALIKQFQGIQKQYPPMVSSVRVNGRKLYEYARNHEVVERPLREVNIYEIETLDEKRMKFRVACSSGTYIRSLCVDIAAKSDNLGCMDSLVRTKVGRFSLDQAVTLEEIRNGALPLMSTYDALSHYEMIDYRPSSDIRNGKRVRIQTTQQRVVMVEDREVLAVYEREHDDVFRCVRGLG